MRDTYDLGVPGTSVATGVQFMKDRALKIANDSNNELMSELASYFDRASVAVG